MSSSSLPSRSSSYPLQPYGWDAGWEAEFAPYAEQGLLPGRVVRVDRGLCDVVTPAGAVRADTEFVVPRDPMKVVCTGDWVAVDPEGSDPRYVRTLLPRRTAFVRSTSSKRSEGQILAANVDHALVAVSLAVGLNRTGDVQPQPGAGVGIESGPAAGDRDVFDRGNPPSGHTPAGRWTSRRP